MRQKLAAFFALIFGILAAIQGSQASALSGQKQIKLVEFGGREHVVGKINFTQQNGNSSYKIQWNDTEFGEHFLSMRPFKCFEGELKYWCRVPYPYENHRIISEDNLTDLEYDLLFIWKGAGEYGINMWNGVYYKLDIEGDKLVGHLNEMDMEKLGVPPEKGELRPIREKDLEEGEPEGHWLPKLVIE